MRRILFALALTLALSAIALPALAGFPIPPPDFAHPDTPHSELPNLNQVNGTGIVPTLIIYLSFPDKTPPPGVGDINSVRRDLFGAAPSVSDYFDAVSYGKFGLSPAAESFGPNDGVVVVQDMTFADYRALVNGAGDAEAGRSAIWAAAEYVDFASFDTGGSGSNGDQPDGVISADELQIVLVYGYVGDDGTLQTDMGARPTGAVWFVDGVTLPGRLITFGPVDEDWNFYAHEIAHAALSAKDTYGYGAGDFDLQGTDWLGPNKLPSTWFRLHLGWLEPSATVVTRDGYYDVGDAQQTGDAYILYDPDYGVDDYFIVENRNQSAPYDTDTQDRGLVIWRIHEDFVGLDGRANRYNGWQQIMLPRGGYPELNIGVDEPGVRYWDGGTSSDAWDPSDPSTPQRVMDRPWSIEASVETSNTEVDNPPSNCAVRAIGPSGPVVRAYFDVPGPGVLVDASASDGSLRRSWLEAGTPGAVSFKYMNTGDEYDTFEFAIVGLPEGWTQEPLLIGLGAHNGSENGGDGWTGSISVTPAWDTLDDQVFVRVRGTSVSDPTVSSESPVLLTINRRDPTLYAGGGGYLEENPQLWAGAIDPDTGWGIPDMLVEFEISGPQGAWTTFGVTGFFGTTYVPVPAQVPPGSYALTVRTPKTPEYRAASLDSSCEVLPARTAELALTSETEFTFGDPILLGAKLLLQPGDTPVVSEQLRFLIDGSVYTGSTNSQGVAQVSLPSALAPGSHSLTIDVARTDFPWAYAPRIEDIVVVGQSEIEYTGSTARPWGTASGMSARVFHDASPAAPVKDATVRFAVFGNQLAWIRECATDAEGVATIDDAELLDLPPGEYALRVQALDAEYFEGSQWLGEFTVTRRETRATYLGPASAQYSDAVLLRGSIIDMVSGDTLPDLPVSFGIGAPRIPFVALETSRTTTALLPDGSAEGQATLVLDCEDASLSVQTRFDGNSLYRASSQMSDFDVLRENASVGLGGDRIVELGSDAHVVAQLTEEPDGYPGDLSLAGTTVQLTPNIGVKEITHHVSPNAEGTVALTVRGMESDVWTVDAVIEAKTRWNHAAATSRELVVYDPRLTSIVSATGTDSVGELTRVVGFVRYKRGAPEGRMVITFGRQSFEATDFRWVAGSTSHVILEGENRSTVVPTIVRLHLMEPEASGTPAGAYRIVMSSRLSGVFYDSGIVTVGRGRVVVN